MKVITFKRLKLEITCLHVPHKALAGTDEFTKLVDRSIVITEIGKCTGRIENSHVTAASLARLVVNTINEGME